MSNYSNIPGDCNSAIQRPPEAPPLFRQSKDAGADVDSVKIFGTGFYSLMFTLQFIGVLLGFFILMFSDALNRQYLASSRAKDIGRHILSYWKIYGSKLSMWVILNLFYHWWDDEDYIVPFFSFLGAIYSTRQAILREQNRLA
jgi:hypothetical protein